MNNEPEQPVEAQSSEPDSSSSSSVIKIAAKTEPKDILAGLVNDLNTLILVFIAAVYYLDCFSLLFLLRFLGQNQSTTAGIRIVVTSNLICILTHLFHSITQPEPREIWNHGGALVDFVGEKPPSRFKLLVYDVLIVSLQILHLALYYKKLSLEGKKDSGIPAPVLQDLEAEEAGVSRADPPERFDTEEGIDMQNLLPEGSNEPGNSSTDSAQDDTTIAIRKQDFKDVFLNTAVNAQSDDSAAAVRRFLDRVNTVRARRAAQETRAAGNTTAT